MSAAVICLSSPSDVLSAVPHLLGFHPSSQSLVLVCLHSRGKSAQVGMLARFDRPEPGRPDEGWAVGAFDALIPALAREDPDAAMLIAYGTPSDDGAVAVEVLGAVLAEVGVQVRERLIVAGGLWRSLDRPRDPFWTVVPGPDAVPSLEFAVVAGSAPAASRTILEQRCAAGPRARAVVRSAPACSTPPARSRCSGEPPCGGGCYWTDATRSRPPTRPWRWPLSRCTREAARRYGTPWPAG